MYNNLPDIPWLDELPNVLLYISTYGLSEMFVRKYLHQRSPIYEISYHLILLMFYYIAHIALQNYKLSSVSGSSDN